MITRRIAVVSLASSIGALASCATTHPEQFSAGRAATADEAILLVGVRGPFAVKYIQLLQDRFPPATNHRFSPIANDVVALPINVGAKNVRIDVFELEGVPAGYVPSGIANSFRATGYQVVRNAPVQISSNGVYYLGTLIIGAPHRLDPEPDADMLHRAKLKYSNLFGARRPIGFSWRE